MVTSLKHYVYRVTFPGMPWYYYGVHTDNGNPYYGSPKKNKWVWEMYEAEVQILQRFSDRREAESIERRILRHCIGDPNCLNAQVGGQPTREQRIKGVKTQIKNQVGIHSPDKPWAKEAHAKACEKMRKEGTGLYDLEVKRKGGRSIGARHVKTGHIQRLGKEQGKKNVESGHMDRLHREGAKAQHSLRYMCLVTGYISTPCGLSHYQRARGIDTSLRVKVEKPE